MEKGLIREIEDFELHHKIIFFVMVFLLTVVITRILVIIKDPNIIIRGFELHHFYYGVILLIITVLLFIFAKMHMRTYITLSAIATGLVIDEFIYILGGAGNNEKYFSTWPAVTIFALIIIAIILIIEHRSKKK